MATGVILGVLALVGTGISYSAQTSAAATQREFATLNAAGQLQSTMLQGRQQQLTANLQAAQAETAQRSANNNAAALREQAEAEERIAQENIRKGRFEFQSMIAKHRAAGAASGVVDTTGSPLDLLVDAHENQAQLEAEQHYQANLQRSRMYRQAQIEEQQGKVSAINAGLHQIDGMAAMARARSDGTQIQLNKFSELASARGAQMAATGQLVSGIGSAAATGYSTYRNRTPGRYSTYG
jgi:hypothetical protein